MLMQMMSAGAMGGGIASSIARALGAGRRADANALALHALVIALGLGAAFTIGVVGGGRWLYQAMGGSGRALEAALTYSNWVFGGAVLVWLFNSLAAVLRGTGNMAFPAAVTCIGVVILVPASPALIFGWGPFPALGIAGGAVALVSYYVLGCVAFVAYLWADAACCIRRCAPCASAGRSFATSCASVRWPRLSPWRRISPSSSAQRSSREFGPAAIAGYGIGARLEYLLVPLVFGLGPLIAIVGTSIGAGQRERALRTAWIGAAMAFALTETIKPPLPSRRHGSHSSTPIRRCSRPERLTCRRWGLFYGMFGLALSLYFASQGAGRLLWPLLGTVARLAIAALGGWLALRWTGELSHVFLAQRRAYRLWPHQFGRRRGRRLVRFVDVAVVHGSRAAKEIANMSGKYLVVTSSVCCPSSWRHALTPLLPQPTRGCSLRWCGRRSRSPSSQSVRSPNRRGPRAERPGIPSPREGPWTLVDAGQTVKRGQALMRIDPTDLRLAMRAHEEAVAAAKARARQPRMTRCDTAASSPRTRFRHRPMTRPRLPPRRQERSSMRPKPGPTWPATRRATHSAADADGVVVETLAEPGQVVAAGQVVVRVAHAGRREAVIELPETLRPAIGSTGRATLYGSGLTGPAKLRQLSDAANRHTRTFEARYVLEGRLADAPLGSTISIPISDGRSAPALQVPIGAIFDPGKGPGVWLVEGETPGHLACRANRRPRRRSGFGRRQSRGRRSRRGARCASAARRRARATAAKRGRAKRGGQRREDAMSGFNLSALAVRERSVTCSCSWRSPSPASWPS